MARERWAAAQVGFFVLIAIFLAVAGSLWIAGERRFSKRLVPYTVLVKDTGGITAGDRVRVAGVPVGRVRDIRLRTGEAWPVAMQVALRPTVAVHRDASARISSEGILGARFLQIVPGSSGTGNLAPGSTIHGEPGFDMTEALAGVDDIAARLSEVADRTNHLLDQLSQGLPPLLEGVQAIVSTENADNIQALLVEIRGLVHNEGPKLSELLARFNSIAATLDESTGDLPEVTTQLTQLLGSVQQAIGPEGQRLQELLDSANQGFGSADEAMGIVIDNRDVLEATLKDLSSAAANLKAFSAQVRERPYSLVRVKGEQPRQPGDGVGRGRR